MAQDPLPSRSQLLAQLRKSVVERKELWAWGIPTGLIPWEGRGGSLMIALWESESRAREENGDTATPEEEPVRYSVDELLERIPDWTRSGVRRFGLESRNGKFLYSLTVPEFKQFIISGRPTASKLP